LGRSRAVVGNFIFLSGRGIAVSVLGFFPVMVLFLWSHGPGSHEEHVRFKKTERLVLLLFLRYEDGAQDLFALPRWQDLTIQGGEDVLFFASLGVGTFD